MRARRRQRAVWWIGLGASAVLHALLFLLWPGARIPLDFDGTDATRGLLADPVRIVDLPASAPPRAAEAERREPTVPRAEIAVRPTPSSGPRLDLAPVERPGADRGLPTLAAGPPRDAPGDIRYARPAARSILPEWRPPRSLYGIGTTVRVHVDESGRATGLVELVPPTPHRGTNRELVRRVRQLDYQPALRNGEPVASWAEIAFVFCQTGVTATSPAPPPHAPGSRCPGDSLPNP